MVHVSNDIKNEVELEGPIKELKQINNDINMIVEQLVDEEAALHAKYELKKAPLYKKRQEVIDQIPKFWLTCLERHPVITSLIEMDDAVAISYLKSIEIQRSTENPINYKIEFCFGENPYFSNDKLIKEFDFSNKDNIKVVNHSIDWKENMDLTATSKKSDEEEDSDDSLENEDSSFFCWFTDENGSDLADLIANDLFPNADMYFIEDSEDDVDGDSDSDILNEANEIISDGEIEGAPTTKRVKLV
ncbi:hypothetical protein GGI05_001728 [Coemansia sp. RSA 2603]|nr:hypothetical protein GGI05_001728 [Coemansia sp. RSA 2603]